MKKRIAFVLLCSLLLLSLSGCVLPELQNEGTTPETTTPEVTTPEVTTPEVTTPENTTPEDTTPITPPDDGGSSAQIEDNLVTQLFGKEPVTIIAPVITMWVGLSSADPLYISVENGEIHLLGHIYSLSYDENAGLTYPEDSFLTWFGEKDEKLAEVYEKIQNTTDFYHLEADTGNDGYAYPSIHFCMIDGVYYFITHGKDSKGMLRLHYGIFE